VNEELPVKLAFPETSKEESVPNALIFG